MIRPNLDGSGGGEKRTTFRPPWVKDGPSPLPCPPSNPWLQQAKQNKETKNVPVAPTLKKPKEKEVKVNRESEKEKEENKPKEKEIKISIEIEKDSVNAVKGKDNEREIKMEKAKDGAAKKVDNMKARDVRDAPGKKEEIRKADDKKEKIRKVEEKKVDVVSEVETQSKPPLPPPPPMAPPPPPPPQAKAPQKPISKEKAMKLESLRSRPRRRPDWTDMMKEVEQGVKLKRVKCNDRSAPILPKTKTKGQFVYDSEKQNAHNLLLKEIQSGVHLKKTKTNDRSKPMLEGLRKFRRQMTIEEIITKSASVADVVAVASEPDELDDIDKVRDDLQSTKQMLALELRNKEALERENKRLLARLANLEAELEKEKLARSIQEQGSAKLTRTAEDDMLIKKLKEEAAESERMTKEMEDKYHKTAEELDLTRAKLESAWLKNAQLEIEVKSKGNYRPPITKQPSTKKMHPPTSEKKNPSSAAVNKEQEESDTVTESESEEEDEIEEVNEISPAMQEERELKLLNNKLNSLKEKKIAASNEKRKLKAQLSRLHHILKDEKKKYKLLQKEVEKMASIMKDVEGENDEEEEEEEEEEEDEEEETETESESEEPEESEDELPENASHQDKVKNLNKRIRNYETLFTRAKKGNYLLKANIERRQDDVNRQKEMSLALQEDLNAVLSELG